MVLAHTRAQLFNEWISAVCSRWSFLKFDQCRVVLLLLLLLLLFLFLMSRWGREKQMRGVVSLAAPFKNGRNQRPERSLFYSFASRSE